MNLNNKNIRRVVAIVILVLIAAMVVTSIIPYLL